MSAGVHINAGYAGKMRGLLSGTMTYFSRMMRSNPVNIAYICMA